MSVTDVDKFNVVSVEIGEGVGSEVSERSFVGASVGHEVSAVSGGSVGSEDSET
jgi:hypothetical protein